MTAATPASTATAWRADRDGALPRAWLLVSVGALTMLAVDCATADWAWAVGSVVVCGTVVWWLVQRGHRASFVGRGAALLAVGALAERALIAFASPVPDQVTQAAKYAHNGAFLGVVVVLGLVVVLRTRALRSAHDRSRTTADLQTPRSAGSSSSIPVRPRSPSRPSGPLLAGVPMPWMTRWPGSFPVFVDTRPGLGSPTSTASSTSTCASATPAR